MHPTIEEIFPYLLKVLVNKKEILDYKWIIKGIDAYGVLQENGIYRRSHEDIQKAALTTDQDLFTPENYPMPFEKFFFVAEIHEKNPQERRCEIFQFQRIDGKLTCNLYTVIKQPVGFRAHKILFLNCASFQEDGQFLFEADSLPGSNINPERLKLTLGKSLTEQNASYNADSPYSDMTWGEHFCHATHFALVCSTYGMFGPVSDTQHYYSTTNPDPIRNAQKIARGNRPKFEWVSSVIEPRTTAPALVLHKGGTHASPKPHERRAHFRRLKSGKSVLVRSTVINKDKMGERGFVFHDYELKVQEVDGIKT